jgi:hypothetical protein
MYYRHFLLPIAGLTFLFAGCSSPKPAAPEQQAPSAAAPAKPRFNFGAPELTPSTGSGNEATFTVKLRGGSEQPAMIGMLINERQNGEAACYVFSNLTNADNMLVADAGTGSVVMGAKKSLANKQCELLKEGTSSTADASGVVATFHVRFKSGFKGPKHVWVAPTDGAGNGPELKQAGDWTVL